MRLFIFVHALVFIFSVQDALLAQKPKSKIKSKRSLVEHPVAVPVPLDSNYIIFRPKLSMQKALKLAEDYIAKEHIDISSYYLFEAHSIQYGSEKGPKEERWYFWWVNDNGSMGDYVEITVSMEGVVDRLPSM